MVKAEVTERMEVDEVPCEVMPLTEALRRELDARRWKYTRGTVCADREGDRLVRRDCDHVTRVVVSPTFDVVVVEADGRLFDEEHPDKDLGVKGAISKIALWRALLGDLGVVR